MKHLVLSLSLTLLALIPSGCSKTESVPEFASLGDIDESGQTADVSTEQAEAFARDFEAALGQGNLAAAGNLILSDRIIDRVVQGLEMSGELETGFRKGMSSNNPVTATLSQLASVMQGGGSYSLVRTAVRGQEMHVIFRLIDPNQALNYHDFRVILEDGEAKADQIFVAATGESFAETIISAVGPAVRSQQSTMSRMTGDAKQKMKDLEMQSKMMLAARGGDGSEALRIYQSLPAELQNSKAIQLARVLATQTQSDAEYISAMDDYASRFPNDPSLALMSFDRAVMKKDVPAVKECIASLDKWTGGDDYLKLLTASVVSDWGDLDYAKELYAAADPARIGTADAHDYRLSAALRCSDFAVVLEELRILRDDFEYEFELEESPDFAEFVKSKEFQKWKDN